MPKRLFISREAGEYPDPVRLANRTVTETVTGAQGEGSADPVAALAAWSTMAHGAYPPNTLRAWKADWAAFTAYCAEAQLTPLPASPHTVRSFVLHCTKAGKRPATIRRYLATITRAHRAADLLTPCSSEPVRLALKEMGCTLPARQRQAHPLGWEAIKTFLETAGKGIRADRERALLCVAYDTMARRSELVALNVEDIKFTKDGSGTALIRRSKTDQAGQGVQAYLARETVRWLRVWLKAAGISEGAVFRRLVGRGRVGERLHADQIADIYKRVARWVKLPPEVVEQVSGHSIRVGATQDLLVLNIDLASVMQAGRWKSTHMPMRYGEYVLATRGAMARASALQVRSDGRGNGQNSHSFNFSP